MQGLLGGDNAGLSLIYAVTVDRAKRWRGIRMPASDLETLNTLWSNVDPLKASE